MDKTQKERLLYIDNLRLFMIILVVIMHAAVTYSGMGSWYYKESSMLDILSTIIFGFYQSFTQGYFMGFLFLISGYFVPSAYDKKGFSKFVKDRLFRLGLPTLLYMLIIHPFIIYFILDMNWLELKPSLPAYYFWYITSLDFIGSSGPLWFALALLIFTLIYAFMRLLTKNRIKTYKKGVLNTYSLVLLILGISILAFLIRIVQPIDTSILNMQLSFFSQYIVLFVVGILSYRNEWFSKLDYAFGIKWLKMAIIPGLIIWSIIMLTNGALDGKAYFKGGLRLESSIYALWESFVAVSMSIGLIALFKEKFNYQNNFIKVLSNNSFAVYVFHAPILIILSQAMSRIDFPPLIKFLLLCIFGLTASFVFSHYILKKTPLLNKII